MTLLLSAFVACSPVSGDDSADQDSATDPLDSATDTATDSATETSGVEISLAFSGNAIPDATPDHSGETLYYLDEGGERLCWGPADGSADPSCRSDDFHAGSSLAISPDGESVVVSASAAAESRAAVVVIIVSSLISLLTRAPGSPFTPLTETIPYMPRAVEMPAYAPGTVYFSGTDPDTGGPGIFTVPMAGGEVLPVVSDLGTIPTGLVVASDGTVYSAGGDQVFAGGSAIVSGARLGSPAGVALTPDESTLLVSSLSATGTAQVLMVNLADHSTSVYDAVLRERNGAGGLHQSPGTPGTYAWADSSDSGGGVFRVRLGG